MTIALLAGKALSPFLALFLIWAIAAPIRRQVQRLPESAVKRILLTRVN